MATESAIMQAAPPSDFTTSKEQSGVNPVRGLAAALAASYCPGSWLYLLSINASGRQRAKLGSEHF
jgi:hypothetical protein